MDSDAFWCITLGLLALRAFWKSQRAQGRAERSRNTVKNRFERRKARKEEQEKKDIAEIISVIIPTIGNG